jgi:GR25 family glycosyltransferase involved in LPS biosynthesis
MGWEFFQKIYCISVRERADRRAEAKRQFAAVGLSERVEFFIVEKDPTPEAINRGIYESHIRCIQKGIGAGADRILIFEDDILFDRFSPEKLEKGIAFLKSTPDWKVFLLGCLVNGMRVTESDTVMKVKYRSLSHAYALNRSFAEELLGIPYQGLAYDCLFCPYDEGIYAIYPTIAFQSDSPSGNAKYFNLERRRRLFGGFQRIQKFNEYFYRHRMLIIAANAATVALLSVIAAYWLL